MPCGRGRSPLPFVYPSRERWATPARQKPKRERSEGTELDPERNRAASARATSEAASPARPGVIAPSRTRRPRCSTGKDARYRRRRATFQEVTRRRRPSEA